MRSRPLRAVLALLTLALAAGPGRAADAPRGRYQIEHAVSMSAITDLVWSPDGRRLAFVLDTPDTAENTSNSDVWLLEDGAAAPRRITRGARGDVSPTFSPGGDTIAFVSNRGEDARPTIWMMSMHGGDPWPFGAYEEGVGEVKWSPDGRYLAYTMTDTLPRQIKEWRKRKWDAVIEDERLQYPALWVVEVATGTKRRLTSGPHYVWFVRWSPDSRSIAFLDSPTGGADASNDVDIGVVPVAGGPIHHLGGIGGAFAWSPNGKWIAWPGNTRRDQFVEKTSLWVAAAAGGRPRDLTSTFDGEATPPVWSPGSDTLYFHAPIGASTGLAAVAVTGGPVRTLIDRAADAGTPVASPSGRLAWVEAQPTTPPEVWIEAHAGAGAKPVTSFHAAIARLDLGTTRTVSWTSTDGVHVEGLLLRPPGASERAPLKTLVMLHGGPYGLRAALGFQDVAQAFATRGYQVFMPNFRSSGGYGTAFLMRKRAEWGGQDWQDVMTGIDSLVKWRLADANKLGVFGRSYGGYLSAWAITQTNRFDAACVTAAAVDLPALYGQTDTPRYRVFEFGGFPWDVPENWRRSSTITHIKNAKTPTLITHDEEDRRIPIAQAQELYRALTALGVPVQLVRYPRESHVPREPRHRMDQLMRQIAWFDRWVR